MSDEAKSKRVYVVGSSGPELFVPSTKGQIVFKAPGSHRAAAELSKAITKAMGKSCGFRVGRFVLRLRWLPRSSR